MSLSFTWLGHSAFQFNIDGHSVLIDPFISNNPLSTADANSIPADVILLTHGHGDHIGDTVDIAKRTGAKVAAIVEVAKWLNKQGLDNVTGWNIGGTIDLDYVTVKMVHAFHSSGLPDGSYGGMPAGLILTANGKTIYHAGDTGLFGDMALIGEHDLDFALLPIGDHFTMGPEDSIKAIKLLKPRYVVPIHYNTFPNMIQDASSWAQMVNRDTDAQPIVLDPGASHTIE